MYRSPVRLMSTVAAAALPAALFAALLPAGSAHAAAPAPDTKVELPFSYDVVGQAVDASSGAVLPIAPTVLHGRIFGDEIARAGIPVHAQQVHFLAFGLVPVTARVDLLPRSPLKGQLTLSDPRVFSASGEYDIKLTDVTVAGRPAMVGPHCSTAVPVVVGVQADPGFSVFRGGPISGTFTIGDFADCGPVTPLLDATVSGPGNSISLRLSDFHLQL